MRYTWLFIIFCLFASPCIAEVREIGPYGSSNVKNLVLLQDGSLLVREGSFLLCLKPGNSTLEKLDLSVVGIGETFEKEFGGTRAVFSRKISDTVTKLFFVGAGCKVENEVTLTTQESSVDFKVLNGIIYLITNQYLNTYNLSGEMLSTKNLPKSIRSRELRVVTVPGVGEVVLVNVFDRVEPTYEYHSVQYGIQYWVAYVSRDLGSNWQTVSTSSSLSESNRRLWASERTGAILVDNQRSEDGGQTWSEIKDGCIQSSLIGKTLYCVVGSGKVNKSEDDGKSWTLFKDYGDSNNFAPRTSSDTDNYIIGTDGGAWYAISRIGVSRSMDEGVNWSLVPSTLTNLSVWRAFQTRQGSLLAMVELNQLFIRPAGSTTWQASNDVGRLLKIVDTGKNTSTIYGYDLKSSYVNGYRVLRSEDGGTTWSLFTELPPQIEIDSLAAFANGKLVIKFVRNTTQDYNSYIQTIKRNGRKGKRIKITCQADSISASGNQILGYDSSTRDVFRIADDGKCTRVFKGRESVETIISAPPTSRTYFSEGNRIHVSSDSGKNWKKLRSSGLAINKDFYTPSIVVDFDNPRRLNLFVPEEWNHKALYTSNNGGKSWQKDSTLFKSSDDPIFLRGGTLLVKTVDRSLLEVKPD